MQEPLRSELAVPPAAAAPQLTLDLLEAALRDNQEELQQRVRLQAAKLFEAAEAAEIGNRAKNALLANVGGELGAPLSTLADECAILLQAEPGGLPKTVTEGLMRICDEGRQLSERIGRLLDVSSIESNTLDVVGTPVDRKPCSTPSGLSRTDSVDCARVSGWGSQSVAP